LTPISIPEEAKLPSVHQLNPLAALLVITGLHHHVFEFRSRLEAATNAGLCAPSFQSGDEARLRDGFEANRQVSASLCPELLHCRLTPSALSQWLRDSLDNWKAEYYTLHPESQIMMTARAMYHLGHVSLSVDLYTLYLATGSKSPVSLRARVIVALKPCLMIAVIRTRFSSRRYRHSRAPTLGVQLERQPCRLALSEYLGDLDDVK
jgi:hypothetical protein